MLFCVKTYVFFFVLVSTGPLRNAHRILKPGGVICSQGECLWLNEVTETEGGMCGASCVKHSETKEAMGLKRKPGTLQ